VPLQSDESANLLTDFFVGILIAAGVAAWVKPIGLDHGVRWTAALPFGDATTALQKERRPSGECKSTDGTIAAHNRRNFCTSQLGWTSRARL